MIEKSEEHHWKIIDQNRFLEIIAYVEKIVKRS